MLYILVICLLVFIFSSLLKRRKKILQEEKDRMEKIEEEMGNTTFREEYIISKDIKAKEMKKFGKFLKVNCLIALVITLGICLIYRSFDISNMLVQFLIILLLSSAISIPQLFNESSAHDKLLQKLFFRDVCEVCLHNNNYHNVKFGLFSNIPDRTIGLMNGDEKETCHLGITCDEFKYSEIVYSHEVTVDDGDGHSSTETVVTFVGIELYLPGNINVNESVRIVPTFMKHGKEKLYFAMSKKQKDGEEHVDIEDIEFNEEYEVFSKDPHSAYYFLDADKIEYLKQYRKTNLISMVVDKDGIYVAINMKESLFKMPQGKNITVDDITPDSYNNDLKQLESIIGKFKIFMS